MNNQASVKDARTTDPYLDRRSGEDRRQAYDLETGAFIPEMKRDGIASSTKGLKTNRDGSVDLFFGPKTPKGKESNYVPTAEGKKYFLLFRFYGPEPAVYEKSWKLNDFELIK